MAFTMTRFSKNNGNIGTGLEYAATDKLILRAEYCYTDNGNKSYHNSPSPIADVIGHFKLNAHDERIGLTYKF